METILLGQSVQGRPIEAKILTRGPKKLLLLGGVHGDEPEGIYLVERYVKEELWKKLEGLAELHVITCVNPDGCAAGTRTNARGVDLNRNLPTKDWIHDAKAPRYYPGPSAGSEPENVLLMDLVESSEWQGIVSAHSWEACINYNGPAKVWAEVYAKHSGCKVVENIGYPTPGSFGTWTGWERGIPTLTIEIQEKSPLADVWRIHARALDEALLFAATHERTSLGHG